MKTGDKAIVIYTLDEAHGIPVGTKVTIVSEIPHYNLIGPVYLVKWGWLFPYYNYVYGKNLSLVK